ncbi:MAG: hypothetical protein HYY93_00190 [Planctomycetes bacterium]|nr:hypothetical protein [Planctomycetota bacterium]
MSDSSPPVPAPPGAAPPMKTVSTGVVLGGFGLIVVLGLLIWFAALSSVKQATKQLWEGLAAVGTPTHYGQAASRIRALGGDRAEAQLVVWRDQVADVYEQRQKVDDTIAALKKAHPWWQAALEKLEGWKREYPTLTSIITSAYDKGGEWLKAAHPAIYESILKLIEKLKSGAEAFGGGDLMKEIPKFYADWNAAMAEIDRLQSQADYLSKEAETIRLTLARKLRLDLKPMPEIKVK